MEVSLLIKYARYLILISFLILSGCILDTESKFSLDELPDATIGKPYSVTLEIKGGAMPSKDNLYWKVTPENSGIDIKPAEEGWYDTIIIYGEPKVKGHISVFLKGGGYGSPPSFFNKTFIINVNP